MTARGLIVDGHAPTHGLDGLLWAVDRDAHEVLGLDPDGAVVRRLGRRHRPMHDAPFNHPASVASTPHGHVYVADGYGNQLVHVFDPAGVLVHRFGGRGTDRGQFSTPHGIIIDRSARVLVADRENDRGQIFDAEGRWTAELRDVHRPMDLAEHPDGSILVSDQVPRLSRFERDAFAGSARPVAVAGHGLAVSGDGSIYLAETPPCDRVVRMVPITDLH